MKILQCYSKGDRRYSAFYARLADGRNIETAYQRAKRDEHGKPYPEGQAKGKKCHYLWVMGQNVPCDHKLRHLFYTMLWWIFFMENPSLLTEASTYDAYKDIYDRHGGIIYQKGRKVPFPDNIEDGCCQALSIAFLVGDGNRLELPPVLQQAVSAYWKKQHGEELALPTNEIMQAEASVNHLLTVNNEVIRQLDRERIKALIAKLSS